VLQIFQTELVFLQWKFLGLAPLAIVAFLESWRRIWHSESPCPAGTMVSMLSLHFLLEKFWMFNLMFNWYTAYKLPKLGVHQLTNPVLLDLESSDTTTGRSVHRTWGPGRTLLRGRSEARVEMPSDMFMRYSCQEMWDWLSKVMQWNAMELHVGGYFCICHVDAILPRNVKQ